ncbi:MAG: hypothetical protein ACI83Y_001759 [Candidatus Azotimanducaceae bacterium]
MGESIADEPVQADALFGGSDDFVDEFDEFDEAAEGTVALVDRGARLADDVWVVWSDRSVAPTGRW